MRIIKISMKYQKITRKTILFLNIRVEMVSLQLKQARSVLSVILNSNQECILSFDNHIIKCMKKNATLIFKSDK